MRCIRVLSGTIQLLVNDIIHRRVDVPALPQRRQWRGGGRVGVLYGLLVARGAGREHRHGPDWRFRLQVSSGAALSLGRQEGVDAVAPAPCSLLRLASRQGDTPVGTRLGLFAIRSRRLRPLRSRPGLAVRAQARGRAGKQAQSLTRPRPAGLCCGCASSMPIRVYVCACVHRTERAFAGVAQLVRTPTFAGGRGVRGTSVWICSRTCPAVFMVGCGSACACNLLGRHRAWRHQRHAAMPAPVFLV